MKDGYSYLSNKHLYFFIDEILKRAKDDPTIQKGILSGIMHGLDPKHHRDVLRAAVKTVFSSGDEAAVKRLSRTIVQGFDYVSAQNRQNNEIRELEASVGFMNVEMQKRGHNADGVTIVKG